MPAPLSSLENQAALNVIDNTSQPSCLTEWLTRKVTCLDTRRNCTKSDKSKVNTVLAVIGFLSFVTLVCGSLFRDSMNSSQRLIITLTSGPVAGICLLGIMANQGLFKSQVTSPDSIESFHL